MKPIYIVIILAIVLAAAWATGIFKIEKQEVVLPEKAGLIKVGNLAINQSVESPLFVKGEAKGFWFFEASFPVKIYDENNFLLGVKPAQALGEWMTENFVPYETKIAFAVPS